MDELKYTQQGDYLLPNITLKEEVTEPLGKYGMMRKAYLKEYRPILFSQYILKEMLYTHCLEIENAAMKRLSTMMAQLSAKNPPSDKATDPMAWTAHMNGLKVQAEELILNELIYS